MEASPPQLPVLGGGQAGERHHVLLGVPGGGGQLHHGGRRPPPHHLHRPPSLGHSKAFLLHETATHRVVIYIYIFLAKIEAYFV